MPISIVCTGCDKKLKVPDAAAGKKIRCPVCKTVLEVPPPEEELEKPDEDLVEPDEEVEETGVSEKPTSSRRKKPHRDVDDDEGYGLDDREEDDEPVRRKKKKKKRRFDEDNLYGDMRGRRRKMPHRGVMVLVLGIVSIFCACLCVCLGIGVASLTINIANSDVPQIENGSMDDSGSAMYTAGQICAYVAIVLSLIVFVAGIALNIIGDKF